MAAQDKAATEARATTTAVAQGVETATAQAQGTGTAIAQANVRKTGTAVAQATTFAATSVAQATEAVSVDATATAVEIAFATAFAFPDETATSGVGEIIEPIRMSMDDFLALYNDPANRPLIWDVRDRDYDEGHIAGAVNIPREETESRLNEFPKDKLI